MVTSGEFHTTMLAKEIDSSPPLQPTLKQNPLKSHLDVNRRAGAATRLAEAYCGGVPVLDRG